MGFPSGSKLSTTFDFFPLSPLMPSSSLRKMSASLPSDTQKLLAPLRQDVLRLLQQLVQTDSVNIPPHGNETPAQLVLSEFLQGYGLHPDLYSLDFLAASNHPHLRSDRNYEGRKNLAVRLAGSGRGKSLLLNGHIDTVPPGKACWSASPWSGELRDGRLYGLGSFDMKAGLAAQAAVITAIHTGGIRLGGDLLFESVVDEEWGGGGGALAARLKGDTADAAVISEGTQLEILRATRGGYVVDLQVEAGDKSGYFSRSEVISPAVPLARLLDWVEAWIERRRRTKTSSAYGAIADPAPVQVLAVEANRLDRDVPLNVPTEATVRVYFQFLPDEDVPAVLAEIRRSLQEFQSNDTFFRTHPIRWIPLYDPPLLGHELPELHPWTRCMAESFQSVRETTPVIGVAPYPSDAFLLHREWGIPTLLFGPCGAGAHNPDEYVDVDSVLATAEVLLAAALLWCNG
jgi:acetylornithine deacetylase